MKLSHAQTTKGAKTKRTRGTQKNKKATKQKTPQVLSIVWAPSRPPHRRPPPLSIFLVPDQPADLPLSLQEKEKKASVNPMETRRKP